jgi:hypothetical protein
MKYQKDRIFRYGLFCVIASRKAAWQSRVGAVIGRPQFVIAKAANWGPHKDEWSWWGRGEAKIQTEFSACGK